LADTAPDEESVSPAPEASPASPENDRGKVEETDAAKPSEKSATDKRKDRIFLALLLVLIAGYLATFLTLSLLRYYNFRGSEFDTAIFNQVIWLLSRFKGAYSTIRGMNLFGDHMAPILFLLTPLYWLKGSAAALLSLQTVVLGLGAIPVYLIARDRLDSRWVALGLGGAYLLYPALQYVNLFDFHPEALGLVFLLYAFLAIERKKFVWFYVLCGLTAICKEDLVLAVLVLGIVVYFMYDRRAGKWVTGVSLVYFLFVVFFLIPHFAPAGYQYSSRLGQFGKSPTEAVKNFFLHPRRTFEILVTRENLRYIFDLLMPVAFLCLFAPIYLLPALPAFVINIISDFQPQHTINYQYAAAIIPFVFIAAIYGIKKFKKWVEGGFRARFVVGGVAILLVLVAVAGNFYLSPSPLSSSFHTSLYASDSHVDALNEGLKLIPADASVSAQTFLLAKLSEREKLYQFPEPFRYLVPVSFYRSLSSSGKRIIFPNTYRMPDRGRSIGPEYVALDRGSDVGIPLVIYDGLVARLLGTGGYTRIYNRDGVQILKKNAK
jgi:uncharacterized membrane protein